MRPGNSGGPLVDDRGQVLTTVFAATVDSSVRGGYGVANETVAHGAREPKRTSASTRGEHRTVHGG